MPFPIEPCPGGFGNSPYTCIDAPEVQPYARGAFTAFDVIPVTDGHLLSGIAYDSLTCTADVLPLPVDFCNNIFEKVPTYGDEDTIVRGCPFHLYAALDCRRTTLEDMDADVRKVFALGEQRALEAAIWTNVIAQPEAVILNTTPGVDGAMSPVQALAALESASAGCYPGRATFHADRGLAAYYAQAACCLMQPVGDGMQTNLGSRWALYGGAPNTGPDGTPAPDGHTWVYSTSQLTLRTFPLYVPEPAMRLVKNPDGGQTNVPFALAERAYIATVECCRFAVLVCLGC